MPLPRRSIATFGVVIATGISLSACATQDYVDKHIATVNERIATLESRVQQVERRNLRLPPHSRPTSASIS